MTQKEHPHSNKNNTSNPHSPIKLPVVLAGALTVCLLTGIFLSNLSMDSLPKPPNLSENIEVTPPLPEFTTEVPTEFSEVVEKETEPTTETLHFNHMEDGGFFELPLVGASGIMGINSHLYDRIEGNQTQSLSSGEGFYVLEEDDLWWKIMLQDSTSGWVLWEDCLINLPDIVPSIVYDNPYASLCTSCSLGKDIPNVTGHKLYHCTFFNKRLNKEEYLTPVLYQTAKKIQKLQQNALSDDYSLLIYEGYRPMSVQNQLIEGLSTLMSQDAEVYEALTSPPWSGDWFVSTGISNHQKGQAVDMTLVKVEETQLAYTGDYQYLEVTQFQELEMPTVFDELSPLAAVFSFPVSTSNDQWKSASFGENMTESAILLHNYATEVGFVPLASEWWHFTDPDGDESKLTGNFLPDDCYSIPPKKEVF